MYPDTDTPPMPIPDEWVETVRASRPERPFERADRYRAGGLDDYAAERLARAPWWQLFDALQPGAAGPAVEAALQRLLGDRARRDHRLPDPARLAPWAEAIREGWLLPEAIRPALRRLLDEPRTSPADILARYRTRLDEAHLDRAVQSIRDDLAGLYNRDPEARVHWAMGRLRSEWLGHFRAARVRERLHTELEALEVAR